MSLSEADGDADTLGDGVPVHDREPVGDGDADREPRVGVGEAVGVPVRMRVGVQVGERLAVRVVLPRDRLRALG